MSEPLHVTFICSGNICRSPMAEKTFAHQIGERIRMLRSFDPRSGAQPLDVEDPYCGDHADFRAVFTVIEASLPGVHNWVDEQLASRGLAS